MKSKLWQSIFTLIFILTACGQTPATDFPLPTESIQPTTLPSATSQPSQTTTPISTTIPATQTIIPLPTIPTFTPTLDARIIVTVTPASPAECPKEDYNLSFTLTENHDYPLFDPQEILALLNKGASFNAISSIVNSPTSTPVITAQDVTGDKTPELLFINFEPIQVFYIYSCSEGQYILHSPRINYFGHETEIVDVKDLNIDGIPEIILYHRGCSGSGCYSIYILEWNGNTFQVLDSETQYAEQMDGLEKVEIKDLNNDGVFEVLMTGGVPALGAYIINPPWRLETQIVAWDGIAFAVRSIKYEPPQFRFQAVQDGDRETLSGNLDAALKSYQEAIFNDNLEWWSSQRQTDTISKLGKEGYPALGTPAPGNPDSTEYPKLAAYAYYRIMLIHTVRGYESDAGTVYNTLQQKFGADPNGRPYVEMATVFWDVYQSTHKMYDSCAAAIQYADEHPEILIPLGSDYHGSQSHTYVAEDVCPFR
ncbi:MAG: hypothetical protein QM730_08365 [Anaerolineales bacterium]